ncbi:cation:proton antiporter [Lentisalinibacter orientalis]|uniref:cation:proton antiporter n=1 Tax=Lentisalinibacter orientalis TaxID=2992241 RepID=UPI00386C9EAF
MPEDQIVLVIVGVVALGVAAQWVAWRLRLPAIVLLAGSGLIVGPGLGWINPSEELGDLLRPVISLCVAIILFEGGLSLRLAELKEAARGVQRLVYLGAPFGWAAATLCAHYIGGLDWAVSLVFGAIMVVTGPTVIMPLLRQSALNRRTASYLKWEGIVNDPIGALLAVLVFQFFVFSGEGSGLAEVLQGVGLAITSGLVFGGLGGWLTGRAFRAGMVPEYLKSPVMLGLVLVVYEASNLMQHEAGLLAVTIMGIVVANMNLPGIGDMKRFKEYITIMLVSVVFVLLTADLNVESLTSIGWRGAALIAAIMVVARPAAIMLATIGAKMEFRERLLLSWIAPRGIVAAATAGVMGPRLVDAGYDADVLLPLVFAVIFATVFAHGLSLNWLAGRLGLSSRHRDSVVIVGASPWTIELARTLQGLKVNVLVSDSSWHNLRAARLAGVPVFYGDILSEFAEESVELAHVRTVLAATSNDAYNALVCTQIAPEVGQRHVFQLPMGAETEDDPKAIARPRRGNVAFDKEAVFERLWRLYVRGWAFYKTKLSENYSYSDFLSERPEDAMQVILLGPDGDVDLFSVQHELEPKPGDTIVYFAPGKPKKAAAEGGADAQAAPA